MCGVSCVVCVVSLCAFVDLVEVDEEVVEEVLAPPAPPPPQAAHAMRAPPSSAPRPRMCTHSSYCYYHVFCVTVSVPRCTGGGVECGMRGTHEERERGAGVGEEM